MKITDARAWLTARSSRIRTEGGEVMIGIPLDMAAEIAFLLLPAQTPGPEVPKAPEPTPEPERVVDTESGPVTQEKAKKKKTKKRGKR
jgi:hypothetical protein